MGLGRYHAKRDFRKTPEPRGRAGRKTAQGGQFVIHKHDATRLHYDLRLEVDGVLVSFAVPKGPSLDPKDKRLAVHVEDHPLDYAPFEGVIPDGQYGAGPVIVWDRGRWAPDGDARAGLEKGHLSFTLDGEKLEGAWSLIRMASRGESRENWLLVKAADAAARRGREAAITDRRPESVVSGREIGDLLAEGKDRPRPVTARAKGVTKGVKRNVTKRARAPRKRSTASAASSSRTRGRRSPLGRKRLGGAGDDAGSPPTATRAPMPQRIEPNLATLVEEAPEGEEWIHEIKFDGYRMLCHVENGRVRLRTRNGHDWTSRFPEIAAAAAELPVTSALLDGEVVSVSRDGTTSFQALQRSHGFLPRGSSRDAAVAPPTDDEPSGVLRYYVFDLLHLDGLDYEGVPLLERKAALERILKGSQGPILYTRHVRGNGPRFFEEARRLGLEGIVSKRADGTYHRRRTREWRKIRCGERQEFVLAGYAPHTADPKAIGSLLLGVHDGQGRLAYSGRVGTGFSDAERRALRRRLDTLGRASSPFDAPDAAGASFRGVRWVEPSLVGEVAFTEWTADHRVRHPTFLGLREDKPAEEVVRERDLRTRERAGSSTRTRTVPPRASRTGRLPSKAADVPGLTNPDRVLWPELGATKRELFDYYTSVAARLLPYVRERPLMLLRCPEGRGKECFYQKHLTTRVPPGIRVVALPPGSGESSVLTIDDATGLGALVQMGTLEIHTWGCRSDRVDLPDRVVFDLDPHEDVPFSTVVEAALLLRTRLTRLGLRTFPMTTGGKGLHVHVPLGRFHTWDDVRGFSRDLATSLVKERPSQFVATATKALRKGRIFIDWLRNGRGATAVAPYSTRAREGAPVAAPLRWAEVGPRLRPDRFTMRTMLRRVRAADPWSAYRSVAQRLPTPAGTARPRRG